MCPLHVHWQHRLLPKRRYRRGCHKIRDVCGKQPHAVELPQCKRQARSLYRAKDQAGSQHVQAAIRVGRKDFGNGQDAVQWLVNARRNGHDGKQVQPRTRHVLNKAHKSHVFDRARCLRVQGLVGWGVRTWWDSTTRSSKHGGLPAPAA